MATRSTLTTAWICVALATGAARPAVTPPAQPAPVSARSTVSFLVVN